MKAATASPPLVLAGRRNFLVRALGFVAAPVAAGALIAPHTPTISPDLVAKMEVWRAVYHDFQALDVLRNERRTDGRYLNPVMTRPGVLSEFGERYHNKLEQEHDARTAMLHAILDVAAGT